MFHDQTDRRENRPLPYHERSSILNVRESGDRRRADLVRDLMMRCTSPTTGQHGATTRLSRNGTASCSHIANRGLALRPALVVSALIPLLAGSVTAAEGAAGGSPTATKTGGLTAFDWVLIGLYAISTIALGWYFGRRQQSRKEYFVGSGQMNPLLIGVSLFATLLSTISYLSMPGEGAGKGPINMTAMLALPLIYLTVGYVLLPVYMRHKVTSAYELLEERLGLGIRLLGASMFLLLRLVWMSLLIYLAAKAVTVMLGIDYWVLHYGGEQQLLTGVAQPADQPVDWLIQFHQGEAWISCVPVIVLFTGFVALIYTTLGGLRAVVITDLMQTALLFGGALLVIIHVTFDSGGFQWFPTEWQANWDTQPLFSWDPRVRITMVGTIITTFVWYVATAGGDQTSVQRFMATKDARAARLALAAQMCVSALVGVTLTIVGFALLGFFRAHPEHLAGLDLKTDADDLFPLFIANHLWAGVSGLVVAAMFAAAMSSIDSGVNSITAVVSTDFLGRFGWQPKSERGQFRLSQGLAFCVGTSVVVGSTFMKFIEGNITEVTNKTVNLLTTPIFALFCFALFIRFSRPMGVFFGWFCGTAVAAFVAFSSSGVIWLAEWFPTAPALFGVELTTHFDSEIGEVILTAVREIDPETGKAELVPRAPISFQWVGLASLAVNLVTGSLASLLINWRHPLKKNDPRNSTS